MPRLLSRTAVRLLALAGLAVALLVPLSASDAQAMTCESAWPLWKSGAGKPYTTSSAFLMCDPVKSSIQLPFTTSGDLLYRNGSTTVWHSNTAGAGHSLRLQGNGAITVYGCSGTNCTQGDHLLWSSYTQVSGSGWSFSLSLSFKPNTSNLYVLEDEVEPNGTNHFHYIGAGTPAPS